MTTYDDEIDLKPYITTMLNNWWKIGLLAFSFATIVFLIVYFQPKSYEATATILIPRSQIQLSIADQFPTIVDTRDARSRLDAYLTIAQSDAIAHNTYQELEDILPEGIQAYNLQEVVEVSNQGDAILITATAPDAEIAAAIANEWAKQTVQAINLAYSGEQPLEEIQSEIETAVITYQDAQTELENFISANPITELETAIQLVESALDTYLKNEAWQVDYHYQQRQRLIWFYDWTSSLKSQLENGNASNAGKMGDALAVMSARSYHPNYISPEITNESPGVGLQFTDATALLDTSSNYARDVDSILTITDQEIQEIEQDLDASAILSYLESEDAYVPLASEIQALKGQLENLTARERELTSERDLAWETYEALLQKETELKTTAQTNAEVTFASPAIPSQQPVAKGTLMKTIIAGILGGMISVMWIIIRMWWQSNQMPDNSDPIADTP